MASAADLVNQGYRKYIGWGDAEANADFNAVHPSKDPGYGGTPTVNSMSADDVVNTARKLNDFYKEQNAPVVSTLQAQQAPLEQRYKDLVANIKGQQGVAENRQTLTTNNELGKRGISSTSGLYQQNMTDALNPIGVAYGGLLNQADTGHSQDVNTLANQIANAQAGNPTQSGSGALNLAGVQEQANSTAAQLAQAMYFHNNPTDYEKSQTAINNASAQTATAKLKDIYGLYM
jgi:hypothetical protein